MLDNRLINKIFLPFALINIFRSSLRLYKEKKIITEVINSNDDFFKALVTLNFSAIGILGQLVSTMPHDNTLTPEDRLSIINKTIIGVIMKFVNDENLLGILYIDCIQDSKKVIVSLNPVSMKLIKIDVIDLLYSMFVTAILITTILFLL